MYKFLIVDDQEDFLTLLQETLMRSFQATVTSARSGHDAIDLMKTGFKFDLIVCDFNMPNGDGKRVFEFVQSSTEPTPFILYTSSVDLPSFQGTNFLGIIPKEKLNRLTEVASSFFATQCIAYDEN